MATRAPAAVDAFLGAVAAALPARGFWNAPVVVGVSGGSDSVALLLALHAIAPTGRAALVVAHAEHDLRATATADARFVAALAGRLGLPCLTRRLAVREDVADDGEGIEGRARRLRYAFLTDAARETAARHVAVAHTADDQAETILHQALRGTGLAGLAGMPAARELAEGVALVRPLLGIPRAAVRDYLRAAGEAWCEDETNADLRYTRNFLRHEILPRVAAGPYPAAAEALVRLGGQAATAAAALASAAEGLLSRHAHRQGDGTVLLDMAPLAGLHRHLLGEVFAALWRREEWPRRDMTARHYERLADLVATVPDDDRGSAADYPGGIRVQCGDGRLVFTPPRHFAGPCSDRPRAGAPPNRDAIYPRISTRR